MVPLLTLLTGVSLCCLSNIKNVLTQNLSAGLREASWPYDLRTPFAYPTNVPMDIDTSEARVFNCPTPLHVSFDTGAKIILENNGYLVIASLNQPTTVSTLRGGVLGNDVYIFKETRYYWNNDRNSGVANEIDGQSTPIHTVTVYYNRKYGSFNNSQNFRDGIAVLVVNVDVQGYIPNPLFTSFENALKTIVRAGSSNTKLHVPDISFFLDISPVVKTYYAYPGAILTRTQPLAQSYSAIVIQFPKSAHMSISIPQFEALTNLQNALKSPISSSVTSYSRGCRPLVQAFGVTQSLLS